MPNVDITNASQKVKTSWLELITESHFESAQSAVETSADVSIADLFKVGNAKANYSQFSEKRRDYLRIHQTSMTSDTKIAYVRSVVPDIARSDFFKCVMGQKGLQVAFEDEGKDGVTAVVTYRAAPGTRTTYTATIIGGKAERAATRNVVILSDGKKMFFVAREPSAEVLRVILNTPRSESARAASIRLADDLSCKARALNSDKEIFLSTDGLVRVSGASLNVQSDCSAVLSFIVASMVDGATFEGINGPELQFALKGTGGLLNFETVAVANVSQCGTAAGRGYRTYSLTLPPSVVPKALLEQATGFALSLPKNATRGACI